MLIHRPGELACISLHQPWASLVMEGVDYKPSETRGYPAPPHLRGQRLGIHASLREVRKIEITADLWDLCDKLWGEGWRSNLPQGALLGTVIARDCRAMPWAQPWHENDRICGDWREGRHAWTLDVDKRLDVPIQMRGHQRIWYVDAAVVPASTVRRCRVCGCTELWACAAGCEWLTRDVCSRCQP